jgi:hypothetical protein
MSFSQPDHGGEPSITQHARSGRPNVRTPLIVAVLRKPARDTSASRGLLPDPRALECAPGPCPHPTPDPRQPCAGPDPLDHCGRRVARLPARDSRDPRPVRGGVQRPRQGPAARHERGVGALWWPAGYGRVSFHPGRFRCAVVTLASARMFRSPEQPSLKAVNSVSPVRPTASRFRLIKTLMAVPVLTTEPKTCRPPDSVSTLPTRTSRWRCSCFDTRMALAHLPGIM